MDFLGPDDLIQIHMSYCVQFKEFQEAIWNTIKATLNVIVGCLALLPAEE